MGLHPYLDMNSLKLSHLCQGQSPDLPIDHQVPLTQGSLTEGEISVQLTPIYSLVYISSFCIENAYFSGLQNKLS
jgi:hypothetical protein